MQGEPLSERNSVPWPPPRRRSKHRFHLDESCSARSVYPRRIGTRGKSPLVEGSSLIGATQDEPVGAIDAVLGARLSDEHGHLRLSVPDILSNARPRKLLSFL